MDSFLSKEIMEGLRRAKIKALRKNSRLRVHFDGEILPVLRAWEGGFALALDTAPKMRGFVDLYDGSKHLYQCLVLCSANEGDQMIYEYKRQTNALDHAPSDYEEDANTPVALLN